MPRTEVNVWFYYFFKYIAYFIVSNLAYESACDRSSSVRSWFRVLRFDQLRDSSYCHSFIQSKQLYHKN